MQTITLQELVRNFHEDDKVLLINPPVYEIRYNWLKWNQPLDLLKFGSYLKNEVNCKVELFDFMLPRETGRVNTSSKSIESTNSLSVNQTSQSGIFDFTYYGRDINEFKRILEEELVPVWKPTKIVITSLTTYWFKGILDVCLRIRNINALKEAELIFVGNLAQFEPKHLVSQFANYVVTVNDLDLTSYEADFSLYYTELSDMVHNNKPLFASLDIRSEKLIDNILTLWKRNIRDFAFFSANLLQQDRLLFMNTLHEIIHLRNSKQFEGKFHGICGFYPEHFEPGTLHTMIQAGFSQLHLEYDCLPDGTLNIPVYRTFREEMVRNNIEFASGFLSGFVYFGLPGENLELVILNSLQILEMLGTYIPKPFTASPGTEEYERIRKRYKDMELQMISPHCYPFSEENGISPDEYQNYLRLSAFLNTKFRGKAFDFFDNSVISKAIQGGFGRGVWEI